jgi:peptidoglycan/xylan/chitin deacetylase (PgdA/CDA1 family)
MTADTWPNGAKIAVAFNVAYEAWTPGKAPGISPMGNPLPAGLLDTQALSWGGYGPRTGIWRLLRVLDRAQVTATFMVSGILAEHAPESVAAIARAGHEICGHGWTQDALNVSLDRDAERDQIRRCLSALESVSGVRPRGWISPRCTPSEHTAELLAGEGLSWFGDVFDTDLPYRLPTASGDIVAIPLQMELNDLPLAMRFGRQPQEMVTAFDYLLDRAVALDEHVLLDVTVHTHLGGRVGWAGAYAQMLERAVARADLWVPTRGELADTAAV